MPPRILIFGTGAIGSIYTYVLSRNLPPSNIVCVCRSNYPAIKTSGIKINSTLWGPNLHVQPTVVRNVQEATTLSPDPYAYIVVTAKALYTTPSTAQSIKAAVSPETAIVLIQNGIDTEKPFVELYPANPVLSTVVYLPCTQTSPGVFEHKEIELLHVGTYPSTAPAAHKEAARAFTDLLASCDATVRLHDDVQVERWSKLLVNASWNPICALSRLRDAEFLRCSSTTEDETVAYVRDVMREIAGVAQACGYGMIDQAKIDFQIGRAKARDLPGVEPSMLADARGERRMEVEAIVGNVLSLGREKGVDTPLLRSLYMLLCGLDGSFARSA